MDKNKLVFCHNSNSQQTSETTSSNKKEALKLLLSYEFEEKECEEIASRLSSDIFFTNSDVMFKSTAILSPHYTKKQQDIINALITLSSYSKDNIFVPEYLFSHKEAGDFFANYLKNACVESLYMLCMEEDCKVLSIEKIQEGDSGTVFADVDMITQKAASQNSKKVILAHNHSSSLMKYSAEDFYATEKLSAYFSAAGITLMEHYVISGGRYHGILYDLSNTDNWKKK